MNGLIAMTHPLGKIALDVKEPRWLNTANIIQNNLFLFHLFDR